MSPSTDSLLEPISLTVFLFALAFAADVFSSIVYSPNVGGVGGTGLVRVVHGEFVVERVLLVGTGNKEGDDVVDYVELRVYVSHPEMAGTYSIHVTLRVGTTTVTGTATAYVGTSPTTVYVDVPRVAQTGEAEVVVSARRVG